MRDNMTPQASAKLFLSITDALALPENPRPASDRAALARAEALAYLPWGRFVFCAAVSTELAALIEEKAEPGEGSDVTEEQVADALDCDADAARWAIRMIGGEERNHAPGVWKIGGGGSYVLGARLRVA